MLYRAYCAELDARGLLDGAGLQRAAAGLLAGEPLVGAVVLFGLYDVNQAQEALVRALLAAGADVFVPAPAGRVAEGHPVFEVARELGLPARALGAAPAQSDRDMVRAVWAERCAGGGVRRRRQPADRVGLRRARRGCVRRRAPCSRRCRTGASARDCAVVVPHGDDVEQAAAALRDAGLPVACRLPERSRRSARAVPAGRLSRAAGR